MRNSHFCKKSVTRKKRASGWQRNAKMNRQLSREHVQRSRRRLMSALLHTGQVSIVATAFEEVTKSKVPLIHISRVTIVFVTASSLLSRSFQRGCSVVRTSRTRKPRVETVTATSR